MLASFMVTAGLALGLFVLCMLGMGIGLLVRGVALRGGCHSQRAPDGTESCDVCGGGKTACKRKRRQRGNPGEARTS